jgi:uncharacterized protein YggU (UPF0235/DUF167 family)
MARLKLKVVPGASRSRIVGWLGDRLKVTVAAPPSSGQANTAVLQLLADSLHLKPQSIHLLTGHANPLKELAFDTLSPEELTRSLAALLPPK